MAVTIDTDVLRVTRRPFPPTTFYAGRFWTPVTLSLSLRFHAGRGAAHREIR